MKLLKTKQILVILIVGFAMFSFGTAMADKTKVVKSQTKIVDTAIRPDGKVIVKPRLKCDLEVRHISAAQCFCNDSLSNVGAMLYRDIWVTVGNYSCPDGKGANNVNAILEVQYFDLMANRLVNTTLSVTIDKNRTKEIKVKNGYVLIKQNPGIKATIRFGTNPISIIDCNLANNRKIERQCQLPLVY